MTEHIYRSMMRASPLGADVTIDFDSDEWKLRWPRELFISEMQYILGIVGDDKYGAASLLIHEAFLDSIATYDALERHRADAFEKLIHIERHIAKVKEFSLEVSPYRIQRLKKLSSPISEPLWDQTQRQTEIIIRELDARGYFDLAWGSGCPDATGNSPAPAEVIADAIGVPGINPLASMPPDPDLFLSVVEVLHDVIARPRVPGEFHSFQGCGYHYKSHAQQPGQLLFLHKVNRIFQRNEIPFTLEVSGPLKGRAVKNIDDAHEQLARDSIEAAEPGDRDLIENATLVFRSHGATRIEKRAALRDLAAMLEAERATLKQGLLRKDESALFEIANKFDIRHKDANQYDDYNEVFLDWIFWWYLGTVRLLQEIKR